MKHFNLGPLHFQASTLTLIFILLVLTATITLGVMAVRRSARPKRTGMLEALRFTCVAFVCAMLLGPEWRTVQESDLQPEIAIIWDESLSMSTEDARRPDTIPGTETILKREELVKRLLKTEFWKTFEADERNRVTQSSFGAPAENADTLERAMTGTNINEALANTLENGQNLRAAIFIGDGDWNLGTSPIAAAQQYRLKGVPLYTLATGSDKRVPDLELAAVNAPTYGIVGENVQIPFTIESSLGRDVRTQIRIRSDSGKERYKEITLRANSTHYDSLLWRIEKKGVSKLSISIPVTNGELIQSNNSKDFVMSGKPESIRVLVIETLPRWEYRFIRNALSRDPGVEVDCLLLHPDLGKGDGPDYIQAFPEKLEDLQKYDVVFVGDVGVGEGQLTPEQADLIQGLVKNQASGVVFIPGSQGNQFSLDYHAADAKNEDGSPKFDLADLIPVELDSDKKAGLPESVETPMRLTPEGEKSLLTMLGDDENQNQMIWRGLPGFYWQAPVIKAKPGSTILAVNEARRNTSGRLPILVTSTAGSGKVLYMAIDSAWRWRRGVEDLYHYRFWGQVARWMSYQRNMAAGERVRLFYTPERPKPGEFVSLAANAFDANGAPLSEGVLQVELTAPNGELTQIELAKEAGAWGRFAGRFRVSQPGEWKLKAFIPNEPAAFIEAKIISQTDAIEKTGRPARFEVLEEMAKVSRGRLVTPEKLDALVKEINALPEPQPLVDSVKLWAHWIAPAILITLLACFWIGRKFNGTF
ncbi:MAG: putative membrane protein [Paracoccaceae bacterium]